MSKLTNREHAIRIVERYQTLPVGKDIVYSIEQYLNEHFPEQHKQPIQIEFNPKGQKTVEYLFEEFKRAELTNTHAILKDLRSEIIAIRIMVGQIRDNQNKGK